MNRHAVMMLVAVFLLPVALSCAQAGNPVSPATAYESSTSQTKPAQAQTHLWGYYDVYIDIENQTAEAALNRSAMFTANVVTFVNKPPTNLAFKIHGTPVAADRVDVDLDVFIQHPFPGMDQYNGYDVRGIFMGDGSAMMAYGSNLRYAEHGTDQVMYDYDDKVSYPYTDPYGHKLVGMPDGYTRWFNLSEFSMGGMSLFQYTPGKFAAKGFAGTATLNPYKYFADGLEADDDLWTWLAANPDKHGVFSAGSTNVRNYYLRFPNSKGVKYGYAIIANWEGTDPASHPSNTPETVAYSVDITPDIYSYQECGSGGDLILDINLFGWQGMPSAIYIESTVLSSVHELTPDEMIPIGGDGYSSAYHVEIPADGIQDPDDNEFWVIAEYDGFDYTNEYGVPNLAADQPLAAFDRFDLYVQTGWPSMGCPEVVVTDIDGMAGKMGGVELAKQGETYENVEIWGDGFWHVGAVAELRKHDDAGQVVAASDMVVDDWKIECTFAIPETLPTGLYDVYVQNCCENEGLGENLVQVVPPYDIIPWDQGPNGEFETVVTNSGAGEEAIDLGIRQNDGGVYILWSTYDPHYASAERYNPDLTSTGTELPMYQPPQGVYEWSNVEFGNSFVEVATSASGVALAIYLGPYYLYEFDENLYQINALGTNPFPIIGWPGIPYGFAGMTNTYDGTVSTYDHILIFGWSERYRWMAEPGENDGYYDSDYWKSSSNTDPNWDFDGWLDGKINSVGVGDDQSAIWGLFVEEPFVRRYTDLYMHTSATTPPTDFGETGTGDGQLTDACDMSIRLSDNRIYIMDKPGGEMRLQGFDNSTGDFVSTSGLVDLPDGVEAWRIDHNDHDQLIYVLLSNNTIKVYKDMAQ